MSGRITEEAGTLQRRELPIFGGTLAKAISGTQPSVSTSITITEADEANVPVCIYYRQHGSHHNFAVDATTFSRILLAML